MILALDGWRQVEAVEHLLHLVGRDELARLVSPILGLGLSNSGHSHRGAAVLRTMLQHLHLPPVTGTTSRPPFAPYETDEVPGKFPPGAFLAPRPFVHVMTRNHRSIQLNGRLGRVKHPRKIDTVGPRVNGPGLYGCKHLAGMPPRIADPASVLTCPRPSCAPRS